MKARGALYEDPGGQLIIRRDGTRSAFLVLDFPPWSFSADASPAAVADSRRTSRAGELCVGPSRRTARDG